MALTQKEEAFCQAIAKYGDKEKVKAYKEAGYSTNMSDAAIQVQADKLFNKPKLSLRLDELRVISNKVAEEKFTISVEQRLEWLKEIVEAGMSKQVVMQGESMIERRENLAASNKAIEILNSMLGTGDDNNDAQSLTINFGVNAPVGEIKVTRGE